VNGDGDTQPWGFTLLRSGTNANPISASQPLPGTDPKAPPLIFGLGREASNATAKITAIDAAATGITAISGASWGAYTPTELTDVASLPTTAKDAVNAGRKWLFIAEGTGAITSANVASAVFTVFSTAGGVSVASPTTAIVDLGGAAVPEPATLTLFGLVALGGLGLIRRRS
jgi:hypothetical protein